MIEYLLSLVPKVVETIGKSFQAWRDRPKPAKGLSHQDAARINEITNRDFRGKTTQKTRK